MTVAEFFDSELARVPAFDTLLLAHVLEHMTYTESLNLMQEYLPLLRPGGGVFLICPQERGYASDPTHVTWFTGEDLQRLSLEVGLVPAKWRSFPLPRSAGRFFPYNEFTVASRKP